MKLLASIVEYKYYKHRSSRCVLTIYKIEYTLKKTENFQKSLGYANERIIL